MKFSTIQCLGISGLLCGVLLSGSLSAAPIEEKSATIAADETSSSAAANKVTTPTSPPAAKVNVAPLARDDEIRRRLIKILDITGRYAHVKVDVKEGVVFLTGQVQLDEHKAWAGELARNTQDVVAVVNELSVAAPSAWNFQPAATSLEEMRYGAIRALPFLACGIVILLLAWVTARFVTRWLRVALMQRVPAALLREVFARAFGFLVLLAGIYLTLRIANLTHLALTIVGGTGLLGLVLGVAFGNITENFLASIFLSMQHPFQVGDLVEVAGVVGYIQRLTTRTTVSMTLDGNEVQIPNSTVYKSVIRNFTTSPNRRDDFTISIPRSASIDDAQQLAMDVLDHHPAVLHDPEPLVLVDSMTDTTAVLRVYFWLNGKEHSWLKVRSSVIRLVQQALQRIEQPSTAETQAAPAAKNSTSRHTAKRTAHDGSVPSAKTDTGRSRGGLVAIANRAEGKLGTEANQIEEQAQEARRDDGENLLKPAPTDPTSGPHDASSPVRA
jgi:small conductance mechanosensitive channel